MKTSRWRSRNRFLFAGATVTAALAAVVAALAAPALARPSAPAAQASTSVRGPGYPPPKGIYKPFINCPLNDPVMHEVMPITDNGGGLAACTAGYATSGSIKIGNITTRVVQPVNVQFGFFTPPQDDASDLLAAFKASTNGEHSVKHLITMSQFQALLSRGG